MTDRSVDSATSDSLPKENTYFSDNPYCNALENAMDFECRENKSHDIFILVFFYRKGWVW